MPSVGTWLTVEGIDDVERQTSPQVPLVSEVLVEEQLIQLRSHAHPALLRTCVMNRLQQHHHQLRACLEADERRVTNTEPVESVQCQLTETEKALEDAKRALEDCMSPPDPDLPMVEASPARQETLPGAVKQQVKSDTYDVMVQGSDPVKRSGDGLIDYQEFMQAVGA
eukprot:gnl/MRDRNA2_/MRDRNA2_59426_c0_seq1.p1 gnl/MRDRNA2_/MRDRNA2_59426_c0~~gnl/MRDRNA2_/MRDRNA2_59426_c0_seq1.p1  ORF type:complete len:191 (-),score=43.13 gnl/MRDRNA2_/MRDRNA2_59426_c0_seq1:451-954(-)